MKKVEISDATFLIVDDELVNICVLERVLEEWNCTRVHSTTDPRQALALFENVRPDIVLLDLMMPGMDGFEVMARLQPLRAPGDYLPILVLTADTTEPTRHRALAAGATDFLTKPFNLAELGLRVSNLLKTRFLHLELQAQNRVLEQRVSERTFQLAQSELQTIECLALAGEFRDDDTGQHARRVARTAALLAQTLGVETERVNLIQRAAPLHDVGKIGISDTILLKPGKLEMHEFETMKTHTVLGSSILTLHHTPVLQMAALIALTHHERWNGKGYPHNLRGEDIPLEGRLLTVADVFDALTHQRPYKTAWPIEQAVAEIASQAGEQFDPRVVEAFLSLDHATLI